MSKLLVSLIGALTLGATLPAFAGPDSQAIERHGDPHEADGPNAGGLKCPPEAPTPQLDHGPRAQTTPYNNRLRQEHYEAQLKACKEKTP